MPKPIIIRLKEESEIQTEKQRINEEIKPKSSISIDDLIKKGQKIYHPYLYFALEKAQNYAKSNGIIASMPYLIAGKTLADKNNYLWQDWFTALTEEHIGIDKKGIFYQNKPVLIILHGKGILTPERIQKAPDEELFNGLAKIRQEEFENLLKGQLPDGNSIPIYHFYEFKKMKINPIQQYAIVMDFETAKNTESKQHKKKEFIENPLVIARAGGSEYLEAYFDKASELDHKYLGNWHCFTKMNPSQQQSSLLFLYIGFYGFNGEYTLNSNGCFAAVKEPETIIKEDK